MSKAQRSKEYADFQRLTDQLLSVPKADLDARVKAHKERAALNPHKRGPKPKHVSGASSERVSRDEG
jgi:hypothetical protein